MKMRFKLFYLLTLFTASVFAQEWKPADLKLETPWTSKVSPATAHQEYPRPQFVRNDWKNLNGLWEYAIQTKLLNAPKKYEGKILVPFAIESSLSGVARSVGKENWLWYKTSFSVPKEWKGKNVRLNFGAVDWETEIFVNGKSIGTHSGGYDEFSFDVTQFLNQDKNELVVRVWDPIDEGFQPHGKQVRKPGGIWYTSVTGIWQTVWLEPVEKTFVQNIKTYPDIDKSEIRIETNVANASGNETVGITVLDNGKEVARTSNKANELIILNIPNAKLWDAVNPFLYDLKIKLSLNGKVLDEVTSYFGMRKISIEKDTNGIPRMMLNNKFVFQFGTLDQGWWPDGLYTPPTDSALAYDVIKLKELGLNTIRKHVKVEPARFYFHCDKLGMLLWQDMPSGDGFVGSTDNSEMKRVAQSESVYDSELKEMIDEHFNSPSIIAWVPFNEGWGQFNTIKVLNWVSHYDATRLCDGPSGWSDWVAAGHMQDKHDYPGPSMPEDKKDNRALVLGEFGGLGLPIENHTWQNKNNWGYRNYTSLEELEKQFLALIEKIPVLIKNGLSAAIYTQTTDVEVEVNGLMTYDRKVMKLNPVNVNKKIMELYEIVK
ncbi:MAG: sugar-binding domain-containing protein [Melioribacteraceae bacterium]